jgi:hypothetical protein
VHTCLNRRIECPDRQKRAVSSALFDKATAETRTWKLWNVYESGTPITKV